MNAGFSVFSRASNNRHIHTVSSAPCCEWDEMKLEIKYLMLPVKDREASVQFFTENLGFELAGDVRIRNHDCTALRINANSPLLVLEEFEDNLFRPIMEPDRIVLNTDDCLRDYYKLKTLGVRFVNKPEYLSVGLTVQFADPSGNIFALFEQRDYHNN